MWPLEDCTEDFTHALDRHTRFWMDGLESKVTCESCGLVGRPGHDDHMQKNPKPYGPKHESLKVSAIRVLE
jgi:hypothetical protein